MTHHEADRNPAGEDAAIPMFLVRIDCSGPGTRLLSDSDRTEVFNTSGTIIGFSRDKVEAPEDVGFILGEAWKIGIGFPDPGKKICEHGSFDLFAQFYSDQLTLMSGYVKKTATTTSHRKSFSIFNRIGNLGSRKVILQASPAWCPSCRLG
jgi:hypothetical protein